MPSASCACDEDVVPEPRLEVALQLRQVEVRPAAAGDRLPRRVEHVQAEVEQAARHRLAVDEHVALGQVPAARADEQRRDLVVQPVALARPGRARSSARCASIMFCWPSTRFDQVGEFASSKSAMKTLAPELSALITIFRSVGPVISTRRSWRSGGASATCHVALADVPRLLEEVGELAGEQALLPRRFASARSSSRRPPNGALQRGDELERLGGEDRARRARRGARRLPGGRLTWL